MEKNYPDLYEKIFKKSQELVILFEEDGTIVDTNITARAELADGEPLEGRDITQIFPLTVFKNGSCVYWEQSEQNKITFAYRTNQTCFSVKLLITWLYRDERKLGAAFALNDTERSDAVRNHQKAMEEVKEATKMKTEFTANITHELRTPINGIKGMAEGLFDTELTQEQEDTLSIILKCCDDMTKIINDILDFSKMEAGKLSIEYREFNFKKFLDDLLVMNAVKINAKGLKLVVDVGKSVPTNLIGDELRLGQVLNNLFSNACKFTSQGQIGLEVANTFENDSEVELFFMVMDSGIGISDQEKDKLFKSFSQVDGSITRRFGGTGLGLSICKQLVELMGGSITVESEKGKGSTFSFSVRFKKSAGSGSKSFPEGRVIYDKKVARLEKTIEETQPDPDREKKQRQGYYINTESLDEDSDDENFHIAMDLIERLIICIELSAWNKAEEIAGELKNLVAGFEKETKDIAFKMLLSVRKEEHDKALSLVEELKNRLERKEL